MNEISAYCYALDRDCPGKVWWEAPMWHDAVDRALGVSREQDGGRFALFPFRAAKVDDQWRVLAAYPTPRTIGEIDEDWLGIETVIAWDPVTNRAEVLGDPVPQLVGTMAPTFADPNTTTLFGQPRVFFQAWARDRARYFRFVQNDGAAVHNLPNEPDLAPGALIVGDARQVRWNPATMPATIECAGCDVGAINRAILRTLKLPTLRASTIRAAA